MPSLTIANLTPIKPFVLRTYHKPLESLIVYKNVKYTDRPWQVHAQRPYSSIVHYCSN